MKKSQRWQNRYTKESLQLPPGYSPTHNRTCAWGNCARNSPGTWPGLVCRVRPEWPNLLWEGEDVPIVIPLNKPIPLAGLQGMEEAKLLKEDTPVGQSKLRRHPCSIGRDSLRWHQNPSPHFLSRCQSPSPSLPQSHPVAEQLSHSMKNLNLYTRPQKSRSSVHWSDAPTSARKPKKQVRFEVEGDLSCDPTLPPGLAIFLVEGFSEEWDAPGPVPEESLQPPPSEGPQWHPIHTGGARPKALAHPSAHQSQSWPQLKPEEPDPVNHTHKSIHAKMEKMAIPTGGRS